MEQKKQTVDAEDMGINPPAEARITTMFNNIGTGAMIGGFLPFVHHIYNVIAKRPTSVDAAARGKWSALLATVGGVVGAVLGEVEGRRLQSYRHKVSDTIADHDNRIAQLEARSQNWVAREDAREKSADSMTR